ncbi:hypothetical protein AVEN_69766-1 [Araneus ventricosus]|uniref:DUF4371 domain-containing protein n=1 Tax=Araneus ventricosus TaxID=182803 RepID=A0A4Y2CXU6_ARAVE|nr:hypothetical protein AVEN_69766-1 [Araneus ventricosus]
MGVSKGLTNFSTELDSSLKDYLTSATVWQNHRKNEISKASFVSVIANETTDVSSISQMVVVLQYVLSNGQPVERPPGHDAKSIAECI